MIIAVHFRPYGVRCLWVCVCLDFEEVGERLSVLHAHAIFSRTRHIAEMKARAYKLITEGSMLPRPTGRRPRLLEASLSRVRHLLFDSNANDNLYFPKRHYFLTSISKS